MVHNGVDYAMMQLIAEAYDLLRSVDGIAAPALPASLSYYDTYRREHLPANLIQAQRDLFGAHTYRRIDRPGSFHTDRSTGNETARAGAVITPRPRRVA
jgi:6-phosphogluconate dehydrogenase